MKVLVISIWGLYTTEEEVRLQVLVSRRGLIIQRYDQTVGELDYFSAHIRLRGPDKSEDEVETARKTQWCQSRWSKGARKRRRVQWGSTTKKQSIG
ncbi:hypothetical protein BHM03_00028976 [Ensete ventricosum]|nr:hypothetical protein BHM03_00028976 [Ensete ventricosum]